MLNFMLLLLLLLLQHQALNDLQGIMQDPTDCTSLPCLSPESSFQEDDEDSKEW